NNSCRQIKNAMQLHHILFLAIFAIAFFACGPRLWNLSVRMVQKAGKYKFTEVPVNKTKQFYEKVFLFFCGVCRLY
ncbi:MAG: hypothetical protein J6S82_08455, partial [Bacteroidales bacterium]|nr:hypothetical protein [Bacteroidales bacterium]